MTQKRYKLVYDTEISQHLMAIERKHHAFIRNAIETLLSFEPDVETRNRKPLIRTTPLGARCELRCGMNNRFRVFYSVYPEQVHILATGVKIREQLYIGGKEVELCTLPQSQT